MRPRPKPLLTPSMLRPSCAAMLALSVLAAPAGAADDALPGPGSISFCLFETPTANDRRAFVNLAHVQSIEVRSDEVRIRFGGGNLGSGHEAQWPVRNRDEAAALIRRMQDAARACR